MRLKILHIIQDQKFPDSAYELFESVAPGTSEFVLPNLYKPIKYLRKIQPKRVSGYSFLNPIFCRSLEQYDVVILHALNQFNCELVLRCSSKVNFLWIGLGFDYYDLIVNDKLNLLGPLTREIVDKYVPSWSRPKKSKSIKTLVRKLVYSNMDKVEAIKRIRWFSPVLDNEYQLLRDSLPLETPYPDFIDWNYGVTAQLIESELSGLSVEGSNVLLGNSASPFNNHFEAFALLKTIEIPVHSSVIVPLSYGNNQYREKVIEYGSKLFGKRFVPITDFMPFKDYMRLVSTCSTVIMNHNRQQAGGNIASALYMGAKVFLNSSNHFYEHYTNYGATLFDIEQLTGGGGILGQPLETSIVDKNRAIVRSLRARSVLEEKTRKLIQTVFKQSARADYLS